MWLQFFQVPVYTMCGRGKESMLFLIIPIIMAHYENLINNTEDIVVAISHMVVGLYSVTI